MAYTPHVWVSRVGVGLNIWRDTRTNTLLELTNEPTSITTQGTPFNVQWLNEMEEGIRQGNDPATILANLRLTSDPVVLNVNQLNGITSDGFVPSDYLQNHEAGPVNGLDDKGVRFDYYDGSNSDNAFPEAPTLTRDGSLETQNYSAAWSYQFFNNWFDGGHQSRNQFNGDWGPWESFLHESALGQITNLAHVGTLGNTLSWTNPTSEDLTSVVIFRAEKDISDYNLLQCAADSDVISVFDSIGSGSGGTNQFTDPYIPTTGTTLYYKAFPQYHFGGANWRGQRGNQVSYDFQPIVEVYLHQVGVKAGSWSVFGNFSLLSVNTTRVSAFTTGGSLGEFRSNEVIDFSLYDRVSFEIRNTSAAQAANNVRISRFGSATVISVANETSDTFQEHTVDISTLTGSGEFQLFQESTNAQTIEIRNVRLFNA